MTRQRPQVLKAYGTLSGADAVVELGELGPWRPKLVATDLDGTLLDSAGEVTPRTRAALEACWDAGIPVVGVTGRGPRLLDSVRTALDGRGIAVLAQGGFVVDLERDEVLRTVGLPRDQASAVIARIEQVTGPLIVAVEDAAEQSEIAGPLRVQHGFNWPYPEPAHLLPRHEVLPDGPVLKAFLRSSTLGQDELLALAKQVTDPAQAEVTHAGLGFIEVLPPGITKATGLAIALERYGVGFADVLVFGDMPNDLPMIAAAAAWTAGWALATATVRPPAAATAAIIGRSLGMSPNTSTSPNPTPYRSSAIARPLALVMPGGSTSMKPSPAWVTSACAGLGFIEVLPPGITKATGLAIALERYGVGFGDVLVFGDMPNDLPMITAVGAAGGRAVAVANAHPAVRAATSGVTSGHDADGVARYLEAVLGDV